MDVRGRDRVSTAVSALHAKNREVRSAVLRLPPGSDWVVERFADDWELLDDSGGWKSIRVRVAQPVHERLGLMVLIAGQGARVVEPAYRWDADAELGARLLRRYRDGQ